MLSMSDPVSNREIEDVLSSIRRLVSVEKRSEGQESSSPVVRAHDTETGPRDAAPTPQGAFLGAVQGMPLGNDEKLVLSPSFRVAEKADQPEDHDIIAPEQADHAEAGDDSLSLEQWQISPEHADRPEDTAQSAAEHSRDDAEPAPADHDDSLEQGTHDDGDTHGSVVEASETHDAQDLIVDDPVAGDMADHWPEKAIVEHAQDEEPDAADVAPTAEEASVQENVPEEEITTPTLADRELEARIAEVEAAVAATQGEWDPDGDDADDYYAARAEPLPWEDYMREADAPETELPETDIAQTAPDSESDAPEEQGGPAEDRVTSEADMLAAMRKSRTDALARHGVSDARDAEDEDAPSETLDFASRRGGASLDDAADAFEDAATPGPAPRDDGKTDRNGDWYSEDAVMDEDALRDLVADIVRQELQGTLGERITRNVRKLVRREIHRAMMGQDFD